MLTWFTVEYRFLEPQFYEPPDNSNQKSFPLLSRIDPISRTLWFFGPIFVSLKVRKIWIPLYTAFNLMQHISMLQLEGQSRSQRPRSFWLATGIATSGKVQLRKSEIHGLSVTLRMLRVKSDKSDWFWSQSIVFTQPLKTGMSLGLARGPDISSAWQKGPLGTRLLEGIWLRLCAIPTQRYNLESMISFSWE